MTAFKTVGLSLPPIGYTLVQASLVAATLRGQQTFKNIQLPLSLIGLGCVVASVLIVFRLFPRFREHRVWIPFVLNAIVALIFTVGLACVLVMYAIDLTNR